MAAIGDTRVSSSVKPRREWHLVTQVGCPESGRLRQRAVRYSPRMSERTVVVSGASSGFANEIAIGPHRMPADEPVELEGTDTGPTPMELLCAALGACTSM